MSDLPQPTEAFDWVQAPRGPALVCRPLARVAQHLFTTRHWALGVGRAPDERSRWAPVARALELDPDELVRVRQVHGAMVLVASDRDWTGIDGAEADILVTRSPTLGLAVQAADCVPLLVADRRTHAVGAAHAGWRGLAGRVPSAVVSAMAREFGSVGSDLVAAIGPSIGACCYEVGGDVKQRFELTGFSPDRVARWFHDDPLAWGLNPPMPGLTTSRRAHHWFFDGWLATRDQLVDAGVPIDQIFAAELCTASHPGTFCSYRRDGPLAGRIAGAIRRLPRDP